MLPGESNHRGQRGWSRRIPKTIDQRVMVERAGTGTARLGERVSESVGRGGAKAALALDAARPWPCRAVPPLAVPPLAEAPVVAPPRAG